MANSPVRAVAPTKGAHLLERSGARLIDLSIEIYEGMPIFPAHQRPFMFVNQTHEGFKDRFGTSVGFEAHNWLISEHTGTHTDAILEYEAGGASIDEMPLEYFYGDAICIDLSHVRHPNWITVDDLRNSVAGSGQEIRAGDIVLLYTGHGERTYPSKEYAAACTGLTRDAAVLLAEQGVVNIAIDSVSIDHSDDEDFSGHMVCLEYQIVNTENLTNLDKVVNKRFVFFGLPISFRQGTGSPIRAAAWLSD